MLARIGNVRAPGNLPFADANQVGSWAARYVYTVYRAAWMIGDQNQNFRPLDPINRAEVATAVNRILERIDSNAALEAAEVENLDASRRFPDVAETAWYFASVLAATNPHRVTYDDDGEIETIVFVSENMTLSRTLTLKSRLL